MKSLLLITAFLLASLFSYSQTVKKDSNGNYYAVKDARTDSVKVIETGRTFTTINGEIYKVYQSAKGKLFIYRQSRNGNIYKQYLKLED